MFDHVALDIDDMGRSRAFYEKALQPLGYSVIMDTEGLILFGDGQSMFGIRPGGGGKAHVAFASPDRKTVDAFHQAALEAGGEDNGAPGIRDFHENYYAAFVGDPDGNNIEAVCQKPE